MDEQGHGRTAPSRGATTTGAGAEVGSDENSLSVGRDGPLLLHDISRGLGQG